MGTMTIDAHARHLCILDDGRLIEGREVPLIQSHVTEHLVAWGDTAIGQSPLVKGIRTDAYGEVLVLLPLAVLPDTDGEGQLSALILLRQGMPVVDIKVGIVALCMQFTSLAAFDHHIHQVDILIG